MSSFLACLCCCCYTQETNQPVQAPRNNNQRKKKKTKVVKESRLKTKYAKDDFVIVSDEDRHEKRVKAYCCPICTLYYTRILACDSCINFTCLNCFEDYEKKTLSLKQKLKCPFCGSQKSRFCDYQLDPHSYFDTTNKGFISKEDRIKVEGQECSQRSENKNREENHIEVEVQEEVRQESARE